MVESSAGPGDPGASLLQGDFLDEVVESTLRDIVGKIKVEYRKRLSKALEAANLDGATSKSTHGSPVGDLAALAGPLSEAWQCAPPSSERPAEPAAATLTLNVPAGEHGEGADEVGRDGLGRAEGGRCGSKASGRSGSKASGRARSKASGRSGRKARPSAKYTDGAGPLLLTLEDQQDLMEIHRTHSTAARAAAAGKFAQKGRLANSVYGMMVNATDEMSWSKAKAFRLIASPYFDFAMGCIIIFNAVTIGLETSITRQGDKIPAYLHVLEYSFLLAYVIELFMRIHAVGLITAFMSNWVRFDAVLVVAGVLNFILTLSDLGGDSAGSVVANINMLKMIRLVRLARTVRVIVQFRTLWMLVQGLMYAVWPMLWTALLMVAVIYVFAVIAMEMIPHDPNAGPGYSEAAHNFDTLGESMITLMQFMTLDSVAAVYRPLISSNAWFIIYFLVFILMGPIALMNIVTAIMVESSLRTASEDQEAKKAWESMRKRTLMPKLIALFEKLDTSGNGEVDLDELMRAPDHIKEAIQLIVGLDELEEIFNMLDYDGSGRIDSEEFIDGIMRSQADTPSELIVLVAQSRAILEKMRDLAVRIPVQQDDVTLPVSAVESIKTVARRSSLALGG